MGSWGGPCTTEDYHGNDAKVQRPPVGIGTLRPEANIGTSALLAPDTELLWLRDGPLAKVDRTHASHVQLRTAGYRWGAFETHKQCSERVLATVHARAAENPDGTVVFVTHGGPSKECFKRLAGHPVPHGSGGMTALSAFRCSSGDAPWEVILANDAKHADWDV
eukprot:NODE_5493_length_577_cov_278.471264.p1 GENE.NODE_5493_length_577_cov_278.471264~~NODE_5493_length_577_cov_278.471264.p1  ORF type:complete len:164 (+),score=33.90 NODE_5493_length_577_cov_278.471264:3-494(+)